MLIAKLLFIIGSLAAQAWLFDENPGDRTPRTGREDAARASATAADPAAADSASALHASAIGDAPASAHRSPGESDRSRTHVTCAIP